MFSLTVRWINIMSTYTRTSFLIVLPHEQKYTLVIKVSSHMPATRISLLYQRHKRPNKGIRGGFVVYLCRPSGRYRFLWSPEAPGRRRGARGERVFSFCSRAPYDSLIVEKLRLFPGLSLATGEV